MLYLLYKQRRHVESKSSHIRLAFGDCQSIMWGFQRAINVCHVHVHVIDDTARQEASWQDMTECREER